MESTWKDLLFRDLSWGFALEIFVRTLVMFVVTLVFLRMSGKKGVRQLSIFEVAIIIALGSAAGDPMLNKESALIPSLIVFAVILGIYRLLTYFATKSEKFEMILEGDPIYVIEDGMLTVLDDGEHNFAKDEFFAEMRSAGVEHVGQVKTAILETNGTVSFFYYEDKDVVPGLPVLPKPYAKKSETISTSGEYACTYCGNVEHLEKAARCKRCTREEWVEAISSTRVS